MSPCIVCGDDLQGQWSALCGTRHCEACTGICGICQSEIHDGWDADD